MFGCRLDTIIQQIESKEFEFNKKLQKSGILKQLQLQVQDIKEIEGNPNSDFESTDGADDSDDSDDTDVVNLDRISDNEINT